MTSSYLLANNLRVHYLRWDADGSRPVVLLHGLASNARIWDWVAPQLAQAGLPVYAPDARGHGLTDKPAEGYRFDDFFLDLAAFLDASQLERPVLVGHSWGAQIALDYAARRPAGLKAPAALVMVDGGMGQLDDSGATWEQMQARLTPPPLAGMALDNFLARIRAGASGWHPPEAAIPIILENFEIDAEERIFPRLTLERHMQIVRAMWEFPAYQRYRQVRCPALMIPARPPAGDSADMQEYLALKQRGILNAQEMIASLNVYWMEDSVHDIPLQRPAALAKLIIEFIANL
jgi:pimeloyl-ACP methyl ester carboxylesterase